MLRKNPRQNENIYIISFFYSMMDVLQLESLGLKKKEAKIYLVLLKEGSLLANALAKETNILRSSTYDYLDILVDKGFVTHTIQSGKKYFQAVDPYKLLDQFEERKKQEEEILKEIIPKLTQLQGFQKKNVSVEVFEGKEGMKSAISYILKENPSKLFVYGSSGVGYKLLPFYLEHWHKQRIKRKIQMNIIYNETEEAQERIKKGPALGKTNIRYLQIHHSSLTGTLIYNETVLLTIWNKETPLAIKIQGKDISKTYKENFDILWKTAKKK